MVSVKRWIPDEYRYFNFTSILLSKMMSTNDNRLYVVIRVPKSASTSLEGMMKIAFPDANVFGMTGRVYGDGSVSLIEKLRAERKERKRLWRSYNRVTQKGAWRRIEKLARPGDIVSGHFSIDEIRIDDFEQKLITLVRNPVSRLLSDYNYSRNGYNKRNVFRKFYQWGRIYAAGKYTPLRVACLF